MTQVPLRIDEPKANGSGLTIVLAHGAGAGMDSPFMRDVAQGLAAESFRVVRFEFPYMRERGGAERWGGRPDPQPVLEETWVQVVEQLGEPGGLVIGGKSMGGRIASSVADRLRVKALVCLGYPFHPAGKPSTLRVAHLTDLKTPCLILQGERDALGSSEEIAGYPLSSAIRVTYLQDGDHSFKPRKSSGRTFEDNFSQAVREIAAFCAGL